jgi:hypothetical protein
VLAMIMHTYENETYTQPVRMFIFAATSRGDVQSVLNMEVGWGVRHCIDYLFVESLCRGQAFGGLSSISSSSSDSSSNSCRSRFTSI